MKRFILVQDSNYEAFAEEVNRMLEIGYELHGNTFQAENVEYWLMSQAMVLPKDFAPKENQCFNCGLTPQ